MVVRSGLKGLHPAPCPQGFPYALRENRDALAEDLRSVYTAAGRRDRRTAARGAPRQVGPPR